MLLYKQSYFKMVNKLLELLAASKLFFLEDPIETALFGLLFNFLNLGLRNRVRLFGLKNQVIHRFGVMTFGTALLLSKLKLKC